MDELDISGKRYISTRRAAREHGYHSDYMGQLIRSGKVAGQKVGRAWYIEEESLSAYLGKEVKKATEPAVAAVVEGEVAQEDTQPVVEKVQEVIVQQEVYQPEAGPEKEIAEEPVKVTKTEQIYEEPAAQVIIRKEPEILLQPQIQEEVLQEESFVEEKSTRIPIHTPAIHNELPQNVGGLRYAPDDSPSLPVITRMPQAHAQVPVAHAPRVSGSRFPFVSLGVVGVLAVAVALFASNFVSATIVSEPGKGANVSYAIHW
ncbi:MAG TPA: hypothetical protein VGP13_00705 [Candidatus Paceibacterota bacterium]|nr:hypothetical protein [Candidatus Paceibacterota bacterium]